MAPTALGLPERLSPKLELYRKGIHLLSIPCIWLVFWQDVVTPWLILVPASIVAVLVDFARIRNVPWAHRLLRPLRPLFRRSEHHAEALLYRINGATWLILTITLVSVLFSGRVVALASTIFLVGDAMAALVGRWLGGPKMPFADKSIMGSAVGGTTMVLAVIFVGDRSFIPALYIGLSATLIEAYATWPNDNLTGIWGVCILLSWGL